MLYKSKENSDLIISYYDKNDMSRRYSYNLTRNYPQQRRRRRQRYTTSPDYYDDRPISSDGSTLTSSSIEAMSVIILRLTYVPQCVVEFNNPNKNSQEISHFSNIKW